MVDRGLRQRSDAGLWRLQAICWGSLCAALLASVALMDEAAAQAEPTGRLGLRERFAHRMQDDANSSLDKVNITVSGKPRSFYLHLPQPTPPGAMPLVILFHGGRGSSASFSKHTGMDAVADAKGFATVYPESDGNWADGRSTTGSSTADLDFVRAIIDELASTRGVDRKRVYATGISNGGIFTLRLACDMADTIAAFAPVAASLPAGYADRCRPSRAVPLLLIHGSADEWIPWRGGAVKRLGGAGAGGNVMPVPDTVDFFRRHDGCSAENPSTENVDSDKSDGMHVEIEHFRNCQQGAAVTLVRVIGGGHAWPGSRGASGLLAERLVGRTTHDIDASELIWAFFRTYRLP